MRVPVSVSANEYNSYRVKLKMGKGRKGRAMITTNWKKVVSDAEMVEGHMATFRFLQDHGRFFLMVTSGCPVGPPED